MNALNNNPLFPLPLNLDLNWPLLVPAAGQEGTFTLLQAQTEWVARVGIIPPPEEVTEPVDQR